MSWKGFVTDYLTFTHKDRVGILVLLALLMMVLFLPKLVSPIKKSGSITADTAWISLMKKIEQKEPEKEDRRFLKQQTNDGNDDYSYNHSKNVADRPLKGQLFFFDPNTLSPENWEKLGLRDKTIHTIRNYLRQGGHFRKPADLQRVYGLKPDEYKRLEPYIQIEKVAEIKKTDDPVLSDHQKEVSVTRTRVSGYTIVDINTADTSALIALPGIGSKLAARIVNFRDKLGGFYSIAQVSETFGLPDSTFQKIRKYLLLENGSLKKININTITLDELKTHPYIKWSIAGSIISYRNEHGPFSKVEDIKKVMAVTDDIYNKITPYLTTQ